MGATSCQGRFPGGTAAVLPRELVLSGGTEILLKGVAGVPAPTGGSALHPGVSAGMRALSGKEGSETKPDLC